MRKPILTVLFGFCFISPLSFAGEVNNGGGFSEQNFIFAYTNLERFIDPCLLTEICKLSNGERKILRQIKESLVQERKANSYPFFKSGKLNEFNFQIDGALRIAATGSNVGDPIYINLDLIYPSDFNGSIRAFRVDETIAVLIHELGHHHKIKNHQLLDFIGTKVQVASQSEVQVLSGLRGQVRLTLINTLNPTSVPNFMTYGFPMAMLSNAKNSADVSRDLIESIKCDSSSETLTGIAFKNPKWKEGVRTSLRKASLLLRACIATACSSNPNFSKLKLRNMEFEIGFDLENADDGYSYYAFDRDKISTKEVDDWLPCH